MATNIEADSDLVIVTRDPFNAETPLTRQVGIITPRSRFYVRNHFPVPHVDMSTWNLAVDGCVANPRQIQYDDIRSMPSRTLTATLECAGNGRHFMEPTAPGEQWQYGAVSTAEWTGVPLQHVVEAAGPTHEATEVEFVGADRGWVPDLSKEIAYVRSLPIASLRDPNILLVYAMNGAELPPEHGFPLRVIVPGWYGMASVKWLTGIRVTESTFAGFYQRERYVIPSRGDGQTVEPLSTIALRSLITWPESGARLGRGQTMIRGLAWSGSGPVSAVEVSTDGGDTWRQATLVGDAGRYAWRTWEFSWNLPDSGAATLCSRAIDACGNIQPDRAAWTPLGYMNNSIQRVAVTVAG